MHGVTIASCFRLISLLILVVSIIGRRVAVSLAVQGHLRREVSVIGVELSQRFLIIPSLSLILSDLLPWWHFIILVAACLIPISITLLLVSPKLNRHTVLTLIIIQIPSLFHLILVPSEVILLDASLDRLILIPFVRRINPFSVAMLPSLTLLPRSVPEV